MARRRIIYLTALVGCGVFYWAHREWLSWFLLVAVAFLPWLSLLLSLPAMLTCRVSVQCPAYVDMGQKETISFCGFGALPVLPLRGKLVAHHAFSGEKWALGQGDTLPSDHCGAVVLTPEKVFVYDYLGLFRRKARKADPCAVLVRPKAIAPAVLPDLRRYAATAWVPKPGGGFGENHELRLYRPGDNLRQVHWKLTAKVGKLMVRQTMEALQNQAALTLILSGTSDQLDYKLGLTLYLSRHLLRQGLPHRLFAATGSGVEQFAIGCEEDLLRAIDSLLPAAPAPADAPAPEARAQWVHAIGGDAHG